jgi:ubiquinol-cytochrome c reductase cytochrome b subunit
MIRRTVGALDDRLGAGSLLRKGLRYVFPDHWSFMLGEIALYSFIVLVATGVFLTFYYIPSDATVVYDGSYEPLRGRLMGEQYASVLDLSFDVPAGLLIRQTHHWAANLFLVAIVLHLVRILFTGAFRKPRELNYWIGVTLLGLAIFEGFLGYSLVDDLLSGMGLAIAYAVALSIPVLGADFAFLAWGGEYPGAAEFWPRLEIIHVLLVPAIIAVLITIHLASIMKQKHTQFGGGIRTEGNVVGSPLWLGYGLRSIGLLLATTAALFLIGGLIQVNPIWLWGPYEPYLSTNGAQPDWYVGWLIGALRIMPPLEITVFDYTLVPNPFFGGALFPLVVFAALYAWPFVERRLFGDRRRHELLDRPRDNPRRSAVTAAFLAWVFLVFAAGATDRLYFLSFIPYEGQVWLFRVLAVVGPIVVYLVARRVFEELRARDDHPLRRWTGQVVVRRPDTGGFVTVGADDGHGPRDGDGRPETPPPARTGSEDPERGSR